MERLTASRKLGNRRFALEAVQNNGCSHRMWVHTIRPAVPAVLVILVFILVHLFLSFDCLSRQLSRLLGMQVAELEDSFDPSKLLEVEIFWRDHQLWLKERGFLLRPRYQVDWEPSWVLDKRLDYLDCEDSVMAEVRKWLPLGVAFPHTY